MKTATRKARRKPLSKHARVKKGKLTIINRLNKYFPKVETVVDSNEHVSITVKERDCQGATLSNFCECALARAARRELKADGALIGITYSYVIYGNKAVRFKTPQSVGRELVSFDRNGDFDQGTYALSPISKSQKLGVRRGNTNSDNPGTKIPRYHVHQSGRVRRRNID